MGGKERRGGNSPSVIQIVYFCWLPYTLYYTFTFHLLLLMLPVASMLTSKCSHSYSPILEEEEFLQVNKKLSLMITSHLPLRKHLWLLGLLSRETNIPQLLFVLSQSKLQNWNCQKSPLKFSPRATMYRGGAPAVTTFDISVCPFYPFHFLFSG